MSVGVKKCTMCCQVKPLSEFYVRRASKDGLAPICKPCAKLKTAKWRTQNPDAARAQNKKTYERAKDRYKAAAKRWAEENPARRREIVLKSREARKEFKNASNRKAREQLKAFAPEKYREQNRRAAALRRHRVRGAGGYVSSEWWSGLVALFETKVCVYCGSTAERLTVDHFVPVSLGGRTELGNLILCCKPCNSSKNNTPPEEWVRERCGDKGYREIVRFLEVTAEFRDEAAGTKIIEVAA